MAVEKLSTDPMSIREAAAKGIERLRRKNWINPLDHLKLDLVEKVMGPWLHLYCPSNVRLNGKDPVSFLAFQTDLDEAEFEPYVGPLPESDEYKAEVAEVATWPTR